jgi:hypothetical protein
MRAQMIRVSVALAVLLGASLAAHGDVILNTGGTTVLNVGARDTNVSFTTAVDNVFPPTVPFSDSRSISQGTSSSSGVYSLSNAGFDITMSNARGGRLDSGSVTQGNIYFSVTQDTLYSLSGSYTAIDPNPRAVILIATLFDTGLGTTVYDSQQKSSATANESFVLGGTGGDLQNVSTGSATGTLLAGHHYQFVYQGQIYAHTDGDSASASGNISMRLSPVAPNPVPAPGAAYGGAALLGALSLFKIRRRGSSLPHA